MAKHSAKGLCFRGFGHGIFGIEILLVCEPNRSGSDKDSFRWELPGGKCCDDDLCGKVPERTCAETPEETVVRECREETGYCVAPKKVVSRLRFGKHERIFYLAEITGGRQLRNKAYNSESPQWFLWYKTPRNFFPSHKRIMTQFLASFVMGKKQ